MPTGEVYAFSLPSDVIISEAFVDCIRIGALVLNQFDFQHGDIVRLPNNKSLSIGKKLEEGLLPRGRVMGAYAFSSEGAQVPIYTRPPTALVRMLPNRELGTRICINDNQYRLFDELTTVINIADNSGEHGFIIALKDYECSQDGIYRLLIDVPNDRTRRFWEFALIRHFSFDFEEAPYVFQPRGTIRFPGGFQITPDSKCKQLNGENVFNFEISPIEDAIEFTVESLPIRLYVPALKWKFDEAEWHIEKPNDIWHSEFPTIIYLKHPEERITISLDDPEDDESIEHLLSYNKLKDRHLFACDMTPFKSWFGRDKAFRCVFLEVSGDRHKLVRVVTRSVVSSATLRGDFPNGRLIVDFTILGCSEYFVDIKCNGDLVAEKASIENERVDIPASLNSGTYKMIVFESEEDDTGFGDIVYLPIGTFIQELLNPQDLRGKNFAVRYIGKDIFRQSLSCIYYVDNLQRAEPFDGMTYYARLFAKNVQRQVLASYDVRVEFFNLHKLNIVNIAVKDDKADYVEFLYDHQRKIIVRDEDTSLHRAERYRRFVPLYDDEYVYVIDFVERDRDIARNNNHVANQHEVYRRRRVPDTSTIRRDVKNLSGMTYEQKLDIRLEEMQLSVKAYNCLRRARINNIRQILEYPHTNLHRIRNLGFTVKNEILEKMRFLGIDV